MISDAFGWFAVLVGHRLVEVLASEEEVWRLIPFLEYLFCSIHQLKILKNLGVFVVVGYLEWMCCDETFSNLGSVMLEKFHQSWFVVDA